MKLTANIIQSGKETAFVAGISTLSVVGPGWDLFHMRPFAAIAMISGAAALGFLAPVLIHKLKRVPKVYVACTDNVIGRRSFLQQLTADGARLVDSITDDYLEWRAERFSDSWCLTTTSILRSDRVVVLIEPDRFPLKTALIELGIAIAYRKPIVVFAPGAALDATLKRRIGSLAAHPLVSFTSDVRDAFGLPRRTQAETIAADAPSRDPTNQAASPMRP